VGACARLPVVDPLPLPRPSTARVRCLVQLAVIAKASPAVAQEGSRLLQQVGEGRLSSRWAGRLLTTAFLAEVQQATGAGL
jgi:hypothetical protein